MKDNLIVFQQNDVHQRYVLLRELVADFKTYIFENNLPADLLTKQQLVQHIQTFIPSETYGTRSQKKLFYATFKVCSGNTVQEIFEQFCNEMIDTPVPPEKKKYALTTRQLHNNYRIWCKYYVQIQYGHDCELIAEEDDHSHQHWYCSYNLFTALFKRKYTNKKTFKIHIQPPIEIWQIYLQTFSSQDISSDIQQWAKDEFGIYIKDLPKVQTDTS
jgi:hypothetical protein